MNRDLMASSLLLVFLRLFLPAVADLAADGSALLAFRSAVGRAVLPWNSSSLPCHWKGVICSGNRVTSLRLPAIGLVGQVPAGTVGNLSELSVLSLRYNALSGPLPADLGGCSKLRFMYLNGNRFSGEIPPFLNLLDGLVRLSLAENNFSGSIPSSLKNLTHLTALFLEKNDLSGEMPDLDFPKLSQFNVSYNRLSGRVPPKLRCMPVDSFLGMSMCGGPLVSCPGEASQAPADSKKLSGGAIVGIVFGAISLSLLFLAVIFLFFRRQNKSQEMRSTGTSAVKLPEAEPVIPINEVATAVALPPKFLKKQLVFILGAPMPFELEDLLRASAEVLGRGSSGVTYKVAMEKDVVVAVKRLRDVQLPESEFVKKVEAIGALKHPNLLCLQAYYYSMEEQLLIYDYIWNGSLFSLLHGTIGRPLKWEERITIALDTARGIQHIHSISPTSSHDNIKSSNVLITSSFHALVSDHGIADLVSSSVTPIPSRDYAAPEAVYGGSLTPKADVFSFGVLLLELITGKVPSLEVFNEGGASLPRWVESVIRNGLIGELFDFELVELQSPEEEMLMLLHVGVGCCSEMPGNRPEMAAVVAKIEGIRLLAERRVRLNEKEILN